MKHPIYNMSLQNKMFSNTVILVLWHFNELHANIKIVHIYSICFLLLRNAEQLLSLRLRIIRLLQPYIPTLASRLHILKKLIVQ